MHNLPDTERGSASGRPGGSGLHWGLVVLVLLVGTGLLRAGLDDPPEPPQPRPAAAPDTAHRPFSGDSPSPEAPDVPEVEELPRSAPTRLTIPAIDVDAPLTPVGLDEEGWIEPPPAEKEDVAGWYKATPTPGEKGTSVVAGHVDTDEGPAVFYLLGALKKGEQIEVTREDGRTAVFTVYGIEVFENDDFPAGRVYAATGRPELRILTCGGSYTEDDGYSGNVVVFARLTGSHRGA